MRASHGAHLGAADLIGMLTHSINLGCLYFLSSEIKGKAFLDFAGLGLHEGRQGCWHHREAKGILPALGRKGEHAVK